MDLGIKEAVWRTKEKKVRPEYPLGRLTRAHVMIGSSSGTAMSFLDFQDLIPLMDSVLKLNGEHHCCTKGNPQDRCAVRS